MILACTVLIGLQSVTDGHTHHAKAMAKTRDSDHYKLQKIYAELYSILTKNGIFFLART